MNARSEFVVRRGHTGDLESIVRLEREVDSAPHWTRGIWTEILSEPSPVVLGGGPRRVLFVAIAGDADGSRNSGNVMGFAVGSCVSTQGGQVPAELESLVVASWARRQGIGRALCREVVEWARAQGAVAIELELRATSHGALTLYRRMGFVEKGRRKHYYREPDDDAILMEWDLS